MVTNVEIDPQTVYINRTNINVSFTLNWNEPFDNFDPMVNYTITIDCTNATGCPMMFTTDLTTLDVNLITDLSLMNHTISITANNTVGRSDATIRVIVGKLVYFSVVHGYAMCSTYASA